LAEPVVVDYEQSKGRGKPRVKQRNANRPHAKHQRGPEVKQIESERFPLLEKKRVERERKRK